MKEESKKTNWQLKIFKVNCRWKTDVGQLCQCEIYKVTFETLSRDWRSSNFMEERENINSIETIRWIVRRRIDRFSLIRESEPCARTQKAGCKGSSTRMIDAGSEGTGRILQSTIGIFDWPCGTNEARANSSLHVLQAKEFLFHGEPSGMFPYVYPR